MRERGRRDFQRFLSEDDLAILKTIWTCWFQGRDRAPPVVEQCIRSWERLNPGWEVRCLDSETACRLTGLDAIVTDARSITAASASDVLRISLLHEFGGVWVDSTCRCNRPLDEWLPQAMEPQGFFGFDKPSLKRPIASWFLAAEPGSLLLDSWHRETVDFWRDRTSTDDYFWFHHLFRDLIRHDEAVREAWNEVPKISADGPHTPQWDDAMYRPLAEVSAQIDWSAPVFKLTHRLKRPPDPDSFLANLLDTPSVMPPTPPARSADPVKQLAGLSVDTDNLGDHIQVIAADALLERLGQEPAFRVDRDRGLDADPEGMADAGSIGLILNGWFKRGSAGWPPSECYRPIPIGLHLRPRKSPALLSPESIEFFNGAGPVGCRDAFTLDLLQSYGVDAFESNCLTSLFQRRCSRPTTQTEIFAVSRDEQLLSILPDRLGPATFVNHYTGDSDFEANMRKASDLLGRYRDRAALIVTTLLHCAIPAVAMGIPVVVFYPANSEEMHQSDVERFSSLAKMVPIHSLDAAECVDWSPRPVDLAAHKLALFDRFFELAERWGLPAARTLAFAPPART